MSGYSAVSRHAAAVMACPSDQSLGEFLAGRAGERHDELEVHVQHCATCQLRMESLVEPADKFVLAVHEAGRRLPRDTSESGVEQSTVTTVFHANGTGSRELAPLGDFRLIRELGRGGMGIVYEAQQISLGRRVALKTLQFTRWADAVAHERFQNEARAAALLEHPQIVPIYSVGEADGMPYFTMKLIDGQDLSEVVRDLRVLADGQAAEQQLVSTGARTQTSRDADAAMAGGFTITQSTGNGPRSVGVFATQHSQRGPDFFRALGEVGSQAADALGFAHDRGVLHRDIKPSNLLIDSDGHVWVADFGLAQIESAPGLTATSLRVGTPRYMSPERALGSRGVVDHRSDIYSLGATLYELLALTPLFGDVEGERLLSSIAMEDPLPLRTRNRDIPRDLALIVETAIAKNAQDRYATAQDMAADLRRFLAGEPIAARPLRLTDRAARWFRRHPVAFGAAVAATAASLILATVLAFYTAELSQSLANLREESYTQTITAAWAAAENNDPDVALSVIEQWQQSEGPRAAPGIELELVRERCVGTGSYTTWTPNQLTSVALSLSGRYIGVTDHSGVAVILDAQTRERILGTDHEPDYHMLAVAIAPDEQTYASAGDAAVISIWSMTELLEPGCPTLVRDIEVPGEAPRISRLIYSADGRNIIAPVGKTICCFDVETGQIVKELRGHAANVADIAASPDGTWLASCGDDECVCVWNLETGLREEQWQRREGAMRAVALSSDARYVATASEGGYLQVWERGHEKPTTIERVHKVVNRLRFLPDDSGVLSVDSSGVACIWDLPWNRKQPTKAGKNRIPPLRSMSHPAEPRLTWRPHLAAILDVQIDAERNRVVTVDGAGMLCITDLNAVAGHARLQVPRMDDNRTFAFTTDDQLLCAHTDHEIDQEGRPDRTIWIYDPHTGTTERFPALTGQHVTTACLTPDSAALIAAIDGIGLVRVPRDAPDRFREVPSELPKNCHVSRLVYSPDGSTLLVHCRDGHDDSLLGLDADSGNLMHCVKSVELGSDTISRSGNWLVSHRRDTILLTPLQAGVRSIEVHVDDVDAAALSPDDSLLAVVHVDDPRITLVEVASRRQVAELVGHTASVSSVCFSPDGRTLVSGDKSGNVVLWRLSTQRKLFDLIRAPSEKHIDHIEFSPSGRYLAIGALTEILLWDLRP